MAHELPPWNEIPIAGTILEPGNSVKHKTGDWRTFRPVIDQEKCVRCLFCWAYCPDAAVKIVDKPYKTKSGREYPITIEIDYDYCKGCGICANQCPTKAIQMVEEVK